MINRSRWQTIRGFSRRVHRNVEQRRNLLLRRFWTHFIGCTCIRRKQPELLTLAVMADNSHVKCLLSNFQNSLQYCRVRSDMTMCYRIIFGRVCTDRHEFFQPCLSFTRGHPHKLHKHFSKYSLRSIFFSKYIVNRTAYLLIPLTSALCLHLRSP